MVTLAASKIEESLTKAQGLGLVEETFTLGDCEISIRNLTPDEYAAVLKECEELNEFEFLNAFQEGHVCRAIEAVNGLSLRGVDYIECEEPDPKKPGQVKTVKKERHEWIRRFLLKTWGKEAVHTAYRKFSDVVLLAEKQAKEGIHFLTPDETGEERFRRLVAELKDLENEVPPALIKSILEESGYAHYTREDDKEALNRTLVDEEEKPSETKFVPIQEPELTPVDLHKRIPVHQQPISQAAPSVVPPQQPVNVQPPPVQAVMSKRAAEFLAAEAEFDPELRVVAEENTIPLPTNPVREIAELRPQHDYTDPRALSNILEQPPSGGLNPKFRPPPKF